MKHFEEKLKQFMQEHSVKGDHLVFKESCHSTPNAAAAAHADPLDFIKNICMVDTKGNVIVGIVKGEDKVSTTMVAKVLGMAQEPRLATPAEILEKTGYPCGGTPSFGFVATFLIDPRVMEKEMVYSGGGSTHSLVKISPKHLQEINHGIIVRVRK